MTIEVFQIFSFEDWGLRGQLWYWHWHWSVPNIFILMLMMMMMQLSDDDDENSMKWWWWWNKMVMMRMMMMMKMQWNDHIISGLLRRITPPPSRQYASSRVEGVLASNVRFPNWLETWESGLGNLTYVLAFPGSQTWDYQEKSMRLFLKSWPSWWTHITQCHRCLKFEIEDFECDLLLKDPGPQGPQWFERLAWCDLGVGWLWFDKWSQVFWTSFQPLLFVQFFLIFFCWKNNSASFIQKRHHELKDQQPDFVPPFLLIIMFHGKSVLLSCIL